MPSAVARCVGQCRGVSRQHGHVPIWDKGLSGLPPMLGLTLNRGPSRFLGWDARRQVVVARQRSLRVPFEQQAIDRIFNAVTSSRGVKWMNCRT